MRLLRLQYVFSQSFGAVGSFVAIYIFKTQQLVFGRGLEQI